MRTLRLLLPLLVLVTSISATFGQQKKGPMPLQSGNTIEKTIGAGQSHDYSIALEPEQYAQIIVEQHGIDLVVRSFSPEGQKLGEFDGPNGGEGPEPVSIVALTAGAYRLEVAPLGQQENPPAGRYEIRIVEIRPATEQELAEPRNKAEIKTRALAMLGNIAEDVPQLRRPERRQSWFLRMSAICIASQMPATASATVNAKAARLTIMRWR